MSPRRAELRRRFRHSLICRLMAVALRTIAFLSVITVIEGAIFKKFEGARSKRMFCPPASFPA